MIDYARIASPLGDILAAAENGALIGLWFEGQKYSPAIPEDWHENAASPAIARCRKQLDEYFAGKRDRFDLPLAPRGTAYQQRIWREIAAIPFGETLSYAELAKRAGNADAARAAGAATGRNPVSIVIPCHRVVGSGGALTGYAGGLERKTRLLGLEGARAC
jgi:methylated-DNA-[protein]-cysteine S-methyltransferase